MSATLLASHGNARVDAAAWVAPGGTALVVEDDEAIGALLEVLLPRLGFAVVLARDGAECLRWFAGRAAEVKFVLLDCALPDTQGAALALRLRERAPGLPILLASGRPQAELVRHLAAGGPTGFLAKPFRPAEIADRVQALMALHAEAY